MAKASGAIASSNAAIEFGLRATLLIALALYAIAAWLWRERPANVASPQPLP
jgi:hypothetical protein